ncbi:MAG: DUF2141 domain-containing protein [Bryobacteraceae bacterium]|nr:DUF2141 domain-containing protein [Bryobacteraceae bacterium]
MLFRSLNNSIAKALIAMCCTCAFANTAELAIRVNGIKSNEGTIGCALFATAKGFPMDLKAATVQRHDASREGVTCRFAGLTPGRFAVAVSHDVNGNLKTDTKMFGLPTEDWGVSNNVRHRMRPPNFEEAAFDLEEGKTASIEVMVGR